MIRRLRLILILTGTLGLNSCEDVIKVDLENAETRLVIEASLLLPKEGRVSPQLIKISTTAPFYDNEIPPVTGAKVSVFDDNGNSYRFVEFEPGLYFNKNLIPKADINYHLEVIYGEEVYRATESLVGVPSLQYVEQKNNGGLGGEDIELRVFYEDPAATDDYYLFRFIHEYLWIQIFDDKFVNGNLTFALFSSKELKPSDEFIFEIQGISKSFYEYLFILRSQTGESGGPFETQPATVKGNIINTTDPDNFAFGYFRVSETDDLEYIVQ